MLKSDYLSLCLYLTSLLGEGFFDSLFLIILLNTHFSIHFSVYTQEFFTSSWLSHHFTLTLQMWSQASLSEDELQFWF